MSIPSSVIAVDVDNVLLEFQRMFLKHYNGENGTNWQYENITDHNFWNLFGISEAAGKLSLDRFYKNELFKMIQPIQGAVEAVAELADAGYCQRAVSARPKSLKRATDLSLSNYFGNTFQENSYFTGYKSKVSVCKRLGAFLIIEDSLENAVECAENNMEVLLINQPWNQTAHLHRGIRRAANWRDVLDDLLVA